VTARDGGERWQRTFDGRRLETWQSTAGDGNLAERFGVLELRFHLEASGGSLLYIQRAASVVVREARIPIPKRLAPRVEAREDPAGPDSFKVDVCVELPFAGRLIAYHGIVQIEDAPA
jgi:hypothetical protein